MVVLSPLAEDDLVEIWCTVAADDVEAADNLVDELHQVTRLIALQPMMGRRRPEIGADVRSFPHRDYLEDLRVRRLRHSCRVIPISSHCGALRMR